MRSPDFLHKNAETELCEDYIAAGAVCRFLTNSVRLLDAARETFLPLKRPRAADFSVRFWVDESDRSEPPWPTPYVRGLDHLVFAGFDEGSSMLVDLRARRVIGRFSPAMAADCAYCKSVILPMLMTIMSASVGVAELHCACVAKNQEALLLIGPSGAGKSTLSLALSQCGFGFVSDDRTFCSVENGDVQVWGLPTRLKLRREAASWFPEVQASNLSCVRTGNGDLWLEPKQLNGVRRVRQSRAMLVLFLEQGDSVDFRLSPMSSEEAMNRIAQDLMAELPDATAKRAETVQKIVELPCWLLQYRGQPQAIAWDIAHHLAGLLA
jgi:shikimate kinase